MLSFLKNFCACLAALTVFFIALPLAILISIGMLVASSDGTSKQTNITEGVLVFNLSDGISEMTPTFKVKTPLNFLADFPESTLDICTKIRAAAKDDTIKGIFIHGSFSDSEEGISLAQIAEIRNSLGEFAKSGKKIYSYLENPAFADYYMASAATTIYMNPFGEMEYNGIASTMPFFGAALKKYGVGVSLVKSGEYKDAGEIYTEEKMSSNQKAHLLSVLESLWSITQEDISDTRKISVAKLSEIAASEAIFSAKTALKYKLIDSANYTDGVIDSMCEIYGQDKSMTTFPQIKMCDYSPKKSLHADKIAVVSLSGEITEDSLSPQNISAKKIARLLRKLRTDDSLKAVVLRIDSPGGSAYASEIIRREVQLLAKKVKVVASFGSTAASGAYWIATAADKIFANPQSITGSIGVFSLGFSIEKIAADHGIGFDGVKTAPFADFMTISRNPNIEDLQKLRSLCDEIYVKFVDLIAKSRKMKVEDVKKIADGRIFTGVKAKELHLCDGLGGIEAAIAEAAKLAKCDKYSVDQLPKKDPLNEFWNAIPQSDIFSKTLGAEAAETMKKTSSAVRMFKLSNGIRRVYLLSPLVAPTLK